MTGITDSPSDNGELYHDRWITCTADEVRIRGYYFPWGTKRIPYARIQSVRRAPLSPMRGKARIWGTGNFRYWASLDPGRPRKTEALILDLGARMQPFITPDDPPAVEQVIRRQAHLAAADGDSAAGPFI